MDIMAVHHIDLAEYGGNGEIVIGPQSIRSQTRLKNELARRTVKLVKNEAGDVDKEYKELDAGDMELLNILSFVRKAPFEPLLESYLDYCDKLEESLPGASIALTEAMQRMVEEVLNTPSPLGN